MAKLVDDSEKFISCSFCNERFSTAAIGNHLMMCGNKTDECPNCKKFIRRAIFAYHYENNCANLDVIDNDVSDAAIQRDASLTLQSNNPPQTSSDLAPDNNRHVSVFKIDLTTHPNVQNTISQRTNSATGTTIKCPFCQCDCDSLDIEIHREKCLRNPDSNQKRQQSRINPTLNPNSSQFNHPDESNDNNNIPCEYCNKPIDWCNYQDHTKTCAERYYQRLQEQSQHAQNRSGTASNRCRYCDQEYTAFGLGYHERQCQGNPKNVDSEKQYRSFFRFPKIYIPPYFLPGVRFM